MSQSSSGAMASDRPQRFKLSLPFLSRKKKKKNIVENKVLVSGPDDGSGYLPEAGIGDSLQDIAEGNEEQLQDNGRHLACGCEDAAGDDDHHRTENDDDKLTLVPNPKSLTLDLHGNSSLIQPPMSYKSFDIVYPPGGSPPSRRRTERSSSMKAFDASTRSGSFLTESMSAQISLAGRKGWLSTRCGFKSCSKQIDIESELRSRDRAANWEKHRSHHSRTKDPNARDRDTVNEWDVPAEVDDDVGRKKVAARRIRKGYQKSSKLAPSPGIFPSEAVYSVTPEIKFSLRDPYEEVREAAKYDLPSQRTSSEVENSGRSHGFHTLTDGDGNTAEEGDHPWERTLSPSSSDEELFTTSLEQDGHKKCRRKKWSSNSSDETDIRHRRATAVGSHARSKNTWSNHSLRGGLLSKDDIVRNQNTARKKESRIIFLSTPPRPFNNDDEETASPEQRPLETSSDRFGEYSRLEAADQVQPRFDRTYSMGYKSSFPAGEGDMESTAEVWSKLNVGKKRGNVLKIDMSMREEPTVSRSKEPGQNRSHQIDGQIDDQFVNLRLESDASDSSHIKAYTSLRGSRKVVNKVLSRSLDQDKLPKKKRATYNRRRRGRRAKAPPLPSDLHGKVKESVAVVKSSYDPYTDFRDSMVEMIVEKEIQGATDLEELLRCYLSLNSAEYHSIIVKVFADVWRELFADSI